MARGRRPSGPDLVEGLEGSQAAKRKLKVILETIAGQRSIADACRELGMNEPAFHKVRSRTLREAVEGLEPRPPGRPPEAQPQKEPEVETLKSEVETLRLELEMARVREEIALTMPHLLKSHQKKSE